MTKSWSLSSPSASTLRAATAAAAARLLGFSFFLDFWRSGVGSVNSFWRNWETRRAEDFWDELDETGLLVWRTLEGRTSERRRRRREAKSCRRAGGFRLSWELDWESGVLERRGLLVVGLLG